MNKKTAIIGTGSVQKELCSLLRKKGIVCECIDEADEDTEKKLLKDFERIILPFRSKKKCLSFLSKDNELGDFLLKDRAVIGGMIDDEIKDDLDAVGVRYADYFTNEAYVLKNAYLTSQGALRLLLENTTEYISGKKVLITGFGRIGRSLAFMLKGLGLKVFIAARREESLADARASGFEVFTFSQLPGTLFYYDYIFNTVPYRIFSKKDVEHIRNETLYFELASHPFGADKEDFNSSGKLHVDGGSLPGRYYPAAVAQNIAEYIFSQGGD